MYLSAQDISFLEAGLHPGLQDKGKRWETPQYVPAAQKKWWKDTVTDEKLHFQQTAVWCDI